ncbi:MAG TPA: hypothetical protein EYQ60_09775 [Myxococcales bacterium]|nr:hypothetical protein [Myxococcales bacterium]HIK86455.1 hypothetical protein [Myxococcales bacterium]
MAKGGLSHSRLGWSTWIGTEIFQEACCDEYRYRHSVSRTHLYDTAIAPIRRHRSVVIESSTENFSIRFVADLFLIELDPEVLMYFSVKSTFMQEAGTVKEIVEAEENSEEGPVFVIQPIGDAVFADLVARVGREENLSVHDRSSTGFAVVASEDYQMGQTVEVSIVH